MTTPPAPAPARPAPLAIAALALGVFGIITTEMGVIGVLPRLAERLHTTPATTGWLVGAFALTVAATGPVGVLLASRLPRKAVLATALAVFAVSNAVYALAHSFPLLLAFRVLPALFHPVFFALALTAATRLAPPARQARAATTVFAGVTAGFAFGVPLTSYLADHLTLPAAFWSAAAVNLLACAAILAFFPDLPDTARPTYRGQLRILRRPRLWASTTAVTLVFAAMFCGYGYIAEYLEHVTGLDASLTGPALMAFGILMTAGNLAFGRLLERGLTRTATAYPLLYLALYLLIDTTGPHLAPMLATLLLWGALHGGGLTTAQAWLAQDATDAPEFGNSLFISFSNLGITLGTTTGGLIVTTTGPRHLPLAAAALAAAALAAVLLRRRLGPAPVPGAGAGVGAESGARHEQGQRTAPATP
ncbi:MFS transporter [Kitasatospora sp. NPDC056446]|uniref:MFS transporter n=1 Tax=Kitasatospora sp. NPDC056446 TaxID=3345819 RepID=UPI00369B8800